MEREKPSMVQIVEWARSLSNWGRWGNDDELGTLNLITDEVRRLATASVKTGETVSCAQDLPTSARLGGIANRFMMKTPELIKQDGGTRATHMDAAAEVLQIQFHDPRVTHLDALSHVFWDGKMYNDRSSTNVTTEDGATELGVETAKNGIVTRGVLLDVALARGVSCMEMGEGVFPEDLEEAEIRQGVRIQSGDAVLLNTGFSSFRRENYNHSIFADGSPGWQAACLPWLRERDVAIIGADGNNEVFPNDYIEVSKHPIHSVAIAMMGLWLIDNCELEKLAEACASRKQWTFLIVIAPFPYRGATGCPVNPIAIL